jgi:hypothetical protein
MHAPCHGRTSSRQCDLNADGGFSRVPADPIPANVAEADEGVGRGPGGPPHKRLTADFAGCYPGLLNNDLTGSS